MTSGRTRGLLRTAAVLAAAAAVLWLERRRQARPYVESPAAHSTRNLVLAGIAAVTVHIVETPVVLPVARMVARRRWGLTGRMEGSLSARIARPVLTILLLDYTLYLWHRVVHLVPWLWRLHLVHHVDLDMDASTGLRFHAGELAASVPWRAAQVMMIGATPGALAAWQSMTIAFVLFHHSNTRLPARTEGWLSWILATPRMHAIHHSVDPSERLTNFSSGIALWDRLHGTFRADSATDEVTVGVAGYQHPGDVSLERVLKLPFGPGPLLPGATSHVRGA